jgi:hypothetical protein
MPTWIFCLATMMPPRARDPPLHGQIGLGQRGTTGEPDALQPVPLALRNSQDLWMGVSGDLLITLTDP